MNKPFKQAIVVIIAAVAFLTGRWLWSNNTPQSITNEMPFVGVVQIIEHPALDQTRQGVMDELADAGFIPGKTMQWDYESAQGNPALASQIIQKFVGQKADIIVAIPTTPAQAAAQITQGSKIPVVFASVTDPVGTKLVINPQKPEGNITGVSNFVDVEKQIKAFRKILPGLKRLGFIYNPGEANSVILLEKTQSAAKAEDITVIAIAASKTSEVLPAALNLVGKVDAIFINNDNTALAAFDAVTKVGNEHKIPVFVSDVDCLQKGALAALGADQYQLGRQAGKMVIKILKEKLKPSDIPVEWPKKVDFKLNLEVAKQLGLQFEKDLISQAERMGNE
ncbi:MAG: ABC transporter substrate-binding protein [Alphaproteobacteria bacterium]|nr:ABC transporter substrate-binding protein [Alphaproteobacteria bacterium]